MIDSDQIFNRMFQSSFHQPVKRDNGKKHLVFSCKCASLCNWLSQKNWSEIERVLESIRDKSSFKECTLLKSLVDYKRTLDFSCATKILDSEALKSNNRYLRQVWILLNAHELPHGIRLKTQYIRISRDPAGLDILNLVKHQFCVLVR